MSKEDFIKEFKALCEKYSLNEVVCLEHYNDDEEPIGESYYLSGDYFNFSLEEFKLEKKQ